MITKLTSVSISLFKKGLQVTQHDWDVVETKSLYKLTRTDKYGEVVKRQIKKDDIGQVRSMYRDYYLEAIGFTVRVRPIDVDRYIIILKNKVLESLQTTEENVAALRKAFNDSEVKQS